MRKCGYCGHDELIHWASECAGPKFKGCYCHGFTAHELLTVQDKLDYIRAQVAKHENRGQIGDVEVLDEYGAIREHLGKIMEKAST